MKKQEVLKLNANFFPIGVSDWKSTMVDVVSGAAYPVDITYEIDEDGHIDKNRIESMNVVKSWKDWLDLPIRTFDDFVCTAKEAIRIPPVIVCAKFNKIIFKQVVFPTKANIWKRDNYTCQYTGVKLTKQQLSVDHILPKSRGGDNSWTNLATCDKTLNVWKDDRTPKECGLKLLKKPEKPNNGMVFSFMRDEWNMFLQGGEHG